MKTTTFIYLVENCYGDSNKVYIGKTINSREHAHKKTYGSKIKYTIIDEIESLSRKEWAFLETYWIEQFRQWGFKVVNIRTKGGSGPEFQTEESKINHSKKMKGRSKPKDFGKNHSLKTKGKSRHTEESKNKISEKMKNHPSLYSKKRLKLISIGNSIPIKQLDLNNNLIKIWESQAEIQRVLGFPQPNISAACLGKQKTAYNFKWSF